MAAQINLYTFIFAALAGVLPALLWLWFWLHEDKKYPEPKRLIAKAFLAGMIAVPLVIPFEKIAFIYFQGSTAALFLSWATIEEILKFAACYFAVFHKKDFDEPMDAVIYFITAALGFVALENALFLLSPIQEAGFLGAVITGNLRFVGASLLHTIASATIGVFLAFSFYKKPQVRRNYIVFGLLTAIVLHTVFNLFIIDSNGENTLIVFSVLWLLIAALMLFFEKIKSLAPLNNIQ